MSYKDLLVTLDQSDHGRERLKIAAQLAGRFGAHMTGYYVAPDEKLEASPTTNAADTVTTMESLFEDACRAQGVTSDWLLGVEPIADDLNFHIRTVGLAIVGLGDPNGITPDPQGFSAEDVVLGCGRPVLGVPIANVPERIGRTVLLAWDGSRPASRAMNDALPFLVEAEAVTVLAVDADDRLLSSLDAAVTHLQRHGVAAAAERSDDVLGDGDIAATIFAEADYRRADLVVAGAYGHSRLGEALLGGVSRKLLHQMMVPILMSH
jgi:nucleotide-binding universal stress UspA family protein